MSAKMERRTFITLLGGAAVALPLAARGQQPERLRRIGVLEPLAVDDPEALARVTALAQGLQQLGWTASHNVRIDYRWGAGDADRIRQQAAEMAALAPDAILTVGASTTAPMLRATRTVPVVFVSVVDPVGAGYVDSLARPGGNATGFTNFEYSMGAKWLELLKEIAPAVTRVAVIRDPDLSLGAGQFSAVQTVAPSLASTRLSNGTSGGFPSGRPRGEGTAGRTEGRGVRNNNRRPGPLAIPLRTSEKNWRPSVAGYKEHARGRQTCRHRH
jgi:putative tryptophan/tyrosine transport system substrate-binding protein